MSSENIVTGKKYRILSDATNKVWDVISFFTKASDVYNSSDKTLETTCGSITGISSSLTSTSTTVAASASAVKALNDKITELNSNLKSCVVYTSVGTEIGTVTSNGKVLTFDLTDFVDNYSELTVDNIYIELTKFTKNGSLGTTYATMTFTKNYENGILTLTCNDYFWSTANYAHEYTIIICK